MISTPTSLLCLCFLLGTHRSANSNFSQSLWHERYQQNGSKQNKTCYFFHSLSLKSLPSALQARSLSKCLDGMDLANCDGIEQSTASQGCFHLCFWAESLGRWVTLELADIKPSLEKNDHHSRRWMVRTETAG